VRKRGEKNIAMKKTRCKRFGFRQVRTVLKKTYNGRSIGENAGSREIRKKHILIRSMGLGVGMKIKATPNICESRVERKKT